MLSAKCLFLRGEKNELVLQMGTWRQRIDLRPKGGKYRRKGKEGKEVVVVDVGYDLRVT